MTQTPENDDFDPENPAVPDLVGRPADDADNDDIETEDEPDGDGSEEIEDESPIHD